MQFDWVRMIIPCQENFVHQNLRNDITAGKTRIGRGMKEEGVEGKKRQREISCIALA